MSAICLVLAAVLFCNVLATSPTQTPPPCPIGACNLMYLPVCVTYQMEYGNTCFADYGKCRMEQENFSVVSTTNGPCSQPRK